MRRFHLAMSYMTITKSTSYNETRSGYQRDAMLRSYTNRNLFRCPLSWHCHWGLSNLRHFVLAFRSAENEDENKNEKILVLGCIEAIFLDGCSLCDLKIHTFCTGLHHSLSRSSSMFVVFSWMFCKCLRFLFSTTLHVFWELILTDKDRVLPNHSQNNLPILLICGARGPK